MEVKIEKITTDAKAYAEALKIRDKVMREPLHMSIYEDDLSDEEAGLHFVAYDQGEMVGVIAVKLLQDNELYVHHLAVLTEMQGKSIGKQLLQKVEEVGLFYEKERVVLDARKKVYGFYERLGYKKVGEEFTSASGTGLHWRMVKTLSDKKHHFL